VSTLERAIAIAVDAHAGQRDRSGAPYVLHPLRVMFRLATDEERIAGVLHDVVERSPDWTLGRLSAEGFATEVVRAVDALSRRDGETYEDYILRSATSDLARRVKIADLDDKIETAGPSGPPEKFLRAIAVLRSGPPR
jgi:(p)ppGpp synthase/HD superfamily hydrolase